MVVMGMAMLCVARRASVVPVRQDCVGLYGLSLADEFLTAMFATEVIRFTVTLGVQRRRFVHRHSK
jgi:hypothetical protein